MSADFLSRVERLRAATTAEFELSDSECARKRRLLYSINKQGRFHYRTLRQGNLLIVWRIK